MCCFSRLKYFSVFALLEVGIRCAISCLRVVLLLLCLCGITSITLTLEPSQFFFASTLIRAGPVVWIEYCPTKTRSSRIEEGHESRCYPMSSQGGNDLRQRPSEYELVHQQVIPKSQRKEGVEEQK